MSEYSLPAGFGTYTPTITGVANLAASTPGVCLYLRVGNKVMVFGSVSLDPTAAAPTTTTVGISLPIASDLALSTDLNGTGVCAAALTGGNSPAVIYGDATNNRAELQFSAGNVANIFWTFSFMYELK